MNRKPGCELVDIALYITANEIAPPLKTFSMGTGQKALRKATPQPEFGLVGFGQFAWAKGRKFKVANPSSQAFTGLFKKIKRGRP